MLVTIISPAGDPIVHKAGCQHLNRQNMPSDVNMTIEVSSCVEAAQEYWADFEMSDEEALSNTQFSPCANLPIKEA